jgi:hypothetical protein
MVWIIFHAPTGFLDVECKHIRKAIFDVVKLVLWLPIKCMEPLSSNSVSPSNGFDSVLTDWTEN